ncbi:hypothetical protein AB0J28_17165 [Streptosporangium canum]|uniref:hypothetical protein n=1 Tax=Streptosporangium canum TaxID=324952 RepID=UPI003425A62C
MGVETLDPLRTHQERIGNDQPCAAGVSRRQPDTKRAARHRGLFRWRDYRPIVHGWKGEPVFRSAAVRRRHAVTGFRAAVAYGAGLPGYPSQDEIRRDLDGKDLACWCLLSAIGPKILANLVELIAEAGKDAGRSE